MAGQLDRLAVVAGHEAPLLRTAYLLTGDQGAARGLVTAALVRASRRRLRRDGDPLAAVRRDLVRRALRRTARDQRVPAPRTTEPAAGPPPSGRGERLRQGLLSLPPRTRAALVLRHHDGLTERETAAVLGCTPAAVAAMVERAESVLRALLPADRPGVAPPAVVAPAPVPAGDPDAIYRRPG